MARRFDYVIVGGGSAGCVLANRLSDDGRSSVALIEAGRDTPPDHQNKMLWDSYPIVAYFDPRHHWTDLRVFHQPPESSGEAARQPHRYEQGRVMGGGSSINGMMANRGSPDDYNQWAESGAAGWAWDDVLPFFRKLEHDLDFGGSAHGMDGPIPIRRDDRSSWPGFTRAAAAALENAGLSYLADQNDGFAPGYFPIAINNDGRRASTATSYLSWDVRRRKNLTILANTEVSGIQFEGNRATGVSVLIEGTFQEIIEAGGVILACGAIHTPAMLQRSGIGNGDHLRSLGIAVKADRTGVGRNLQEHPQIAVSALLRPEARQAWERRRHIFAGFRYSSLVHGCDPVDMYGVVVNRGAWHSLGQKMGGFLIWVNKAYSQGWVEIETAEPCREPRVELNLLSDQRDALRIKDGLMRLARLFRDPALQEVTMHPFPSSYTEASRDLAVVTRANRARMEPLARLVDAPAPIRRNVMERKVSGGLSLFELVRDEAALDAFIRDRVHGTWHCCGTARMGLESDELAVTDFSGKVFGVEGLRVGDASLMPSVPRANTNLPTIMIGEKIADHVLRERG